MRGRRTDLLFLMAPIVLVVSAALALLVLDGPRACPDPCPPGFDTGAAPVLGGTYTWPQLAVLANGMVVAVLIVLAGVVLTARPEDRPRRSGRGEWQGQRWGRAIRGRSRIRPHAPSEFRPTPGGVEEIYLEG